MSNEKKIGPWRVTDSKIAFDNNWISVVDNSVIHPNGADGHYGVVKFKNLAIGVLPIDDEGNVWLVGQHRFAHDHYSWELPEGGGPLDIPPLTSAKRELVEETGLTAESWEKFCAFDVSNSVTDEKAICYLAWDLKEGTAEPEASEELTLKRVSFNALLETVMKGEISDSLTIVMTLTAYTKALRGALPAPICKRILASTGGT